MPRENPGQIEKKIKIHHEGEEGREEGREKGREGGRERNGWMEGWMERES